jgi:hypothetical protein
MYIADKQYPKGAIFVCGLADLPKGLLIKDKL